MPTHLRSQIRDAVVAAVTGLTTTGARVYAGRARPLAKDSDPCLLVYATAETSDVHTIGSDPILLRSLTLAVEGLAVATEAAALEETLDQIALEVEPAITADSSLGGLTLAVTLTGTRIAVEAPGERHAGAIRMEFRVEYRTHEQSPGVAA